MEFAFVFVMWTVMMVGLVTPSAAPMILMYVRGGPADRGMMNLLWIILLALLVVLETATSFGRLIAPVSGAAFIAAGTWFVYWLSLFDQPNHRQSLG
jgi:predicted metal-binding membrane protein